MVNKLKLFPKWTNTIQRMQLICLLMFINVAAYLILAIITASLVAILITIFFWISALSVGLAVIELERLEKPVKYRQLISEDIYDKLYALDKH